MIVGFIPSEMQLAKAYYNKSAVLTNYTIAVAQMFHIMDTGKPIDESPIPKDRNASIFDKAQRIVNFEKLISDNTPEPEVSNDITVSDSFMDIDRRAPIYDNLVRIYRQNPW
jgi:hypothetical protein